MATVAFKTLALWLFASGAAGLFSGLLTWVPDSAQYGLEATAFRLAAASLFVPIGGLLWLASDPLSARVFPAAESLGAGPSRADLYAFACVLVGLFLLTDALTQMVYWVVVWRSSRGTGFWRAAASMTDDTTVVYWVSARAQVGVVATKALIGALLLAGPKRLSAGFLRIRKELSGSLVDDEAHASETMHPRDGV